MFIELAINQFQTSKATVFVQLSEFQLFKCARSLVGSVVWTDGDHPHIEQSSPVLGVLIIAL